MMKRGWRATAAALGIALAVGVLLAGMPSPAGALPPATVTLDLAAGQTVPGRCDDATVTVSPDKTGQEVEIQRLTDGAWSVFASGTLGPGSTVTIPLCFGWGALGTVSLRAAWKSDGVHEGAKSPPVDLPVHRA